MIRDGLNSAENSHLEQMRLLRQLELQAYTGIINAFSAQGELTDRKKKLLKELQGSLCISIERHKAEIRRALNDDVIEHVSKVNGESRNEWILEGKRSVPIRRRTVPDTYATKIANAKAKLAIERPDFLRPKYKFFSKRASHRQRNELSDNPVDGDTDSAVLENGGENSNVEDDAESGTGQDLNPISQTCKRDNDQRNVNNEQQKQVAEFDQDVASYTSIESKQVTVSTQNSTHEEHSEEAKVNISRTSSTSLPDPKPVISTVQSLYGKPLVFKSNEDQLNQQGGCLPNIKQVASTVTIGTTETTDIPVSSTSTPVTLQQSNLNLLKRQTSFIVVHRPSKLSQQSRIAFPQQPNNRQQIRVIRQDVAPGQQQLHSSSGLSVSNATAAHTYSNVLNVDLDSDSPTVPTVSHQPQIKQKTFLPTQAAPQQPQPVQIQSSPAEVYHVSQASGEPRIITPQNLATYQKSDTLGYSSVELRKLELQPVLRDQLQQTQKQQTQHQQQQQQLLVLQTHVPQAQHQEQKAMPTRFIYTQTPSQSLQRTATPPPAAAATGAGSQVQPLQFQLQMQRQQQQPQQQSSAQTHQVSQALSQQTTSQHQTQLIQQAQTQIQLQQTQPQVQLQQTPSPIQLQQTPTQIQLQPSQPIMLTQQIKPQQYQISQPQSQQQTASLEEQNVPKHTLSQSHQLKQESQVLLLKGQLLQIQPIGSDHSKARPAVASLINESTLSPGKRLKPETTHKRKLSESIGDWQAEVLPMISKLLDTCLNESTPTAATVNPMHADDDRRLIKKDAAADNQDTASLLRMKENLLSRQYLNQQTFENDMRQLQSSLVKRYTSDDNRRSEIEELFSTFYRDLRILKQSAVETAEPPAKVKIYESG